MRAIGKLGGMVWVQWDELHHAAAVIGTVLFLSVQPRYWARTARNLFARQVLVVGVEPVGFVSAVAAFVGISVVVQLAFWTGKAGQSRLLGPLLVAVVARELGPLLTNIIVLVRSSGAMATELGVLKINGDVHALESQGNDAFLHLVMPRILGMALSTFCLMIVFTLVAFASGYLFGPGWARAVAMCGSSPTPCSTRCTPRTSSAFLSKASYPPCLPVPLVASAG